MTAPSLTEFILACIAEDEAGEIQYRNVGAGRARIERVKPSDRWLRECEAKRRIVERYSRSVGCMPSNAKSALNDIAAVYADRPNYREEWKP